MTRLLPALLVTALAVAAPAAAQSSANADLVGTWTWATPRGCLITRTFLPDGTAKVVNGAKRTEGTYAVRKARDGKSRHVLYDVKADAGGRNCDDEAGSTVGQRWIFYIDAGPLGREMSVCLDPSRAHCMGPYRRK